MKFITKGSHSYFPSVHQETIWAHVVVVWHPNVSSVTGAICLDILKDQWSPALTLKTALLSLQALMCSPEPNDPQDAVVATMYKERHAEFVATATQWTAQYAARDGSAPAVIEVRDKSTEIYRLHGCYHEWSCPVIDSCTSSSSNGNGIC